MSGGLGYFLSRRAVSVLADFRDAEIVEKEIFEDKAVSDALRVSGILPARLPGQERPDLLQKAIEGWAFSAHPVAPEAMAEAYTRMKTATVERVLTYHKLGSCGRLGNQLWEIASTIGLAAYFRAGVSLNADWGSRNVFSVPDDYFLPRQGCEAWRFPFRLPAEECVWMQDWWYWWACESRIRQYFQPRAEFLAGLRQRYAEFFAVPESDRLAVHVRRGDYVGNRLLVGTAYYREAMARFPGMTPFVFSDDPAWCAANVAGGVIVPDAARPEEHLVLMSLCRRHIIGNSTFSYWGALIAGDEETIYPSPWFGRRLRYIDLRWSIPPGWTALESR